MLGGGRRATRVVAVGAFLVVAALISIFQFARLSHAPAVHPARPDDPPEGVPLLYVRDGSLPHTIVAYDWSGTRRGSLAFPAWVDVGRLRPAPDGSGFALNPAYVGDYAAYFDRLGYTTTETDDPAFVAQAWADDNGHLCVVLASGGSALATRLPGLADRVVPVSATELNDGPVAVMACDVQRDTAVVQVQVGAADWRVMWLKLSTGRVVEELRTQVASAIVSHDGAYVATGSAIYRATDLTTPIARIGEPLRPLAFSGDDSLMLVSAETRLVIVDWKTGRQLWTYEAGSSQFGPWLAQARGGDFAVVVGHPEAVRSDVVIGHRNGKTTIVSSRDPIDW